MAVASIRRFRLCDLFEQPRASIRPIPLDSGVRYPESGARFVDREPGEITEFDYFGLEPDIEKESIMMQLLGDRQGMEPLPIVDVTRFWLLRMW